jgi:pimeloyl-ACP methyl ester carboxylesterase
MKTIVFLHGALGAASQFDDIISSLPNNYNSIALDLPQHGMNTDEILPSIESYVDYVIQIIEAKGLQSISLFGYSMGGYIALLIAHRRPDMIEKVLTLATKFDWTHSDASKQLSMLNSTLMQEKVPKYANYLNSLHHTITWNRVVDNTYLVIEKLIAHVPINTKLLNQISIPCRLGVGDQDNMVSLNETTEAFKNIPKGSLYVLPSTIHPIEKANPQLIAQQCINFF